MLTGITYKQRFRLLIYAAIIIFLIAYFVAIKPTLEEKRQYRELQTNIELAQDAPRKIAILEKKIQEYSFLFSNEGDGSGNHEKIHEYISKYCAKNNITFSFYPPLHKFKEKNYLIETNIAELEGRFIKLVKLLYTIEQEMDFGKVVSVKFESKTNLRTKTQKLYMTIFIQHIINYNNDEEP